MSATRAAAPQARHAAADPARPGRSLPTVVRHLAVAAGVALLVLLASYQLDSFRNFQLATVAAYLCATAGLTVLTGLCGQLSLGHGALMATGAYTLALVQNAFAERGFTAGGWLIVSLVAAVLATVVVGAVVGVAAARLRGPYLAGLTLAVAVVVPALTVTFDGVFNGEQGLAVPVAPAPAGLGTYFPHERWQLWVAAAATLSCLVLLANLVRSRYGRAFRAVRDDEVAARLAGIHVARTQVVAFVVSAASAGLGGALLAVLAQSVSPGAFGLTLSLFLLMAVVIGGLGRLAGAAWGALLLVALPDLTHSLTNLFTLSPAAAQRLEGNLPLAIFGATLIVVMIAAPGGVQGLLSRLARALRARWPVGRS
ncbi:MULTISPECIES: branched-chain amino acid ABC transporter permease [unclassified Micromonospora]|uniref:branched-chain amino acid ABC transporter permease n=1 Tax=unclassified Micromonospora TaxID=2617518 RepID=UPI0022B6FE1C|nr:MULTISPECIES: branched-chain amino acid ABC transporter permease [unclassified Micromonospora]MCZ7422677.1 branched-chain amino acid ABC transporter permease [Verrucosispora sp. WMMA2121]WBB90420.1 branched-chain amino acid ABC transporter permease [Verrucosispora sp. WMMC514]